MKNNKKEIINKLNLEIANDISKSVESSISFLKENDVNIEFYINKGISELEKLNNAPKKHLTKSQTFFRRVVLGAEIANNCYQEKTFGSVKFQKLIYLCEQVSRMEFATNYSKQAAGPFDNKLMHSIRNEFLKQKWFKVENVKKGKYNKVEFTPMENVNKYKPYYIKYYSSVHSDIQQIIEVFKKSYTNEVELVATIFSCWAEVIDNKMIFSDKLIVKMVYDWSKEKKKFSENQIINKIKWMQESGLVPVGR